MLAGLRIPGQAYVVRQALRFTPCALCGKQTVIISQDNPAQAGVIIVKADSRSAIML
jgi:hypothetical protein